MNATVLMVVYWVFLFTKQTSGFLHTAKCTSSVCIHTRGHYHYHTSQKTLRARTFGHDVRTDYVTKDYKTRFDVVFVVRNIQNYDVIYNRFWLTGHTGRSQTKSAMITSSNDKIVYFKDVTMVQLSLTSHQESVKFDVYYFMDCGFDADQHLSLKYPEPAQTPNIVLKSWNSQFFRAGWGREERERTCWFLVPFDNYKGRGYIMTTYVIIHDASLTDGAKINIVDVVTDDPVTSLSGPILSNGLDFSQAPGREKVSDVGFSGASATTILYVELACPRRHQGSCKSRSRFDIILKPFTKEDRYCIKVEGQCRFGKASPLCAPEDIPKAGTDLTVGGDAFRTSRCHAFTDLLETYDKALYGDSGKPKDPGRQWMRSACSNLELFCSSIRVCKFQKGCEKTCLISNMRGVCRRHRQWSA